MTRFGLAAGSLLALSISVSAASAASLSGFGAVASGADAGIVKVHGVHRSCDEGRFGWHRSSPWGERIPCRPHRGWGWGWGRGGHRGHDGDNHRDRRHEGRNDRDHNGNGRPVVRSQQQPLPHHQAQQVPASRKWNQGSY